MKTTVNMTNAELERLLDEQTDELVDLKAEVRRLSEVNRTLVGELIQSRIELQITRRLSGGHVVDVEGSDCS